MALGGLLGTFGIGCFLIAWDFTTGTSADFYWVQIEVGGSTIKLESWQLYVSSGIALIMAISLIALGFSFIPKSKAKNDIFNG